MSILFMLSPSTVLCGVVLVLCVVWWLSTRRPPGLPPGPGPALPLLGHLHLMKKDPREQFQQWRRQYGDVFSLYLGGRLVVVLNGLPVIKEALVKMADVFSDRPHLFFMDKIANGRGITLSSGTVWKEQRKVSLEILREFGMGKNVLAEKIQEEITHYIRAIEDLNGEPTDLQGLTSVSISNNACSVVFGKRFEYDDRVFSNYLELVDDNVKHLSSSAATNFFPFLSYLPGDLFHIKKILSNVKLIEDTFLWPQIESHKRSEDVEGPATDFIHAYLRQTKRKGERGEKTSLDDKNLMSSASDLFVAGTETTATTIRWTLLFFLHHPQVQDKCYKEVLDVIGTNRLPHISDKAKMTYLEATIMEVLRMGNVAPFSLQHTSNQDVNFRSFVIPKDAIIMTSLDSVLKDKIKWGDPENFRPERFIGPDGKLVRPEELIPFGIGRRACLGESMARMELFLYLSTLVQRFHFLPPEDDELPSLEGSLGLVYYPAPYKIRAILRD